VFLIKQLFRCSVQAVSRWSQWFIKTLNSALNDADREKLPIFADLGISQLTRLNNWFRTQGYGVQRGEVALKTGFPLQSPALSTSPTLFTAPEAADRQPTSPSHQVYRAQPQQPEQLTQVAQILITSFHSAHGLDRLFIPLLRLSICADLRARLRNQPHYVCLLANMVVNDSNSANSANTLDSFAVRAYGTASPQAKTRATQQATQQTTNTTKIAGRAFSHTHASGTIELSLRTRPNGWGRSRQVPYISNLAVLPQARRQGLARQLLLACEAIALEWGFDCLYLHVLEDNQRARSLYQSLGYHIIRREHNFGSLFCGQAQQLLLCKSVIQPADVQGTAVKP